MMAVRAVLYCCAVLCCAVLQLPFVLLVHASTEVTKNVVLCFIARKCSREQIIKNVLGQKSAQVLILGKAIHQFVIRLK